jgi:glycosyltransferase involved in cell wall biosynthesis
MRERVDVVHVPCGPALPLPKDELLPHMGEMADALQREFRRTRPHVVHAHFWMSGIATIGACRVLRIPTAITFHALGTVKRRQQGSKDTSPAVRLRLEAAVAKASDVVLATSDEEVFELVRMGSPRRQIALVPCGVDTEQFTPDGPREACRVGVPHRIVVVSRLVERKGIGNVIAALAAVPDTELVVAGGPEPGRLADDPEAVRLAQLAKDLGVHDRVVFRGRVERADVPALLRSADLVVCAPWYEPFGLVALEAMACGVPVVSTAVGGLVDTVIDGVTGVHVPPRDVGCLAAAMRDLLADPERRAQLGRAGVVRARARYDWRTIAAETVRAYVTAQGSVHRRERRVG